MTLKERLQTERSQRGRGRFRHTPAAAVAAIVQAFDLHSLAQFQAAAAGPNLRPVPERWSILPLLPQAQYELVRELLRLYDNPYLAYARTPAEIIQSQELSKSRPGLSPEDLWTTSITELWRQEQGRLAGLTPSP